MPQVEEEIKSFALKRRGVLVVGIASVEEINKYAPEGYRPDDTLPGAKSVIVLGGPHPTIGAWDTPPDYLPEGGPTGTPITSSAVALSYWLEGKFDTKAVFSIVYPATGGRRGGAMPWQSIKLYIEMAGLGQRSLMGGVILNPKHGFMYYGATITTLELKPDEPFKGKVCPDPICVTMYEKEGTTPCLDGCPYSCIAGEIEHGEIKEARYDRWHCLAVSMRDRTHGVFIRRAIECALEGKDAEMKQILYGEEFANAQLMAAYGGQRYFGNCWECVRTCPVVARTIKSTNS